VSDDFEEVLYFIGNESVPIQLAQCRFPGLAISNAKIRIYFFQIKYTEGILSNSTRKLLWFEITKMLIAVLNYCAIYYNFLHTFVRCVDFCCYVLPMGMGSRVQYSSESFGKCGTQTVLDV